MMNILKLATLFCAALILYSAPAGASDKELLGAGATFPFPYYQKLFDTYYKSRGIKINYQAIGSGGGIQQLKQKTVDFGGSDDYMKDKEIQETGGEILHVPTCLGAVVITYNIPGDPQLKLTAPVIVDIFFGRITKWNDPRIAELNAGISLPDMNIVTVHRSDGSGTTAIFSDYLAKVSAEWKERIGAGKSLNWPGGLGAKGNPGVAGLVKQVPGSVGYVELIYAVGNKMPYAHIKNKSGIFIEPSIKSVSLAAGIALPDDTRASITDTAAQEGYPISGFTWLLLYKEQKYGGRTKERAENLLKLMWWIVHEGQQLAEALDYAPLPKDAVQKAESILRSCLYGGEKILQ